MQGSLIVTGDGLLAKYGERLGKLPSDGQTKIFVPALNRGGDMARTRVRRSLVAQTGVKFGLINRSIKTKRATKHRLEYELEGRGNETNLGDFRAVQRAKGASSAPWGKRKIFKGSFIVPAYGGRVYVRTGDERGPLKPLYGPNLGREMAKDPTRYVWLQVSGFVSQRLEHELTRYFAKP